MVKRVFEFYKTQKNEWYIKLPEWKGDPEDLQMVEGADQWLDLLSNGADGISITMSDKNFEAAANLTLLRIKEENLGGGGIYYLDNYKSEKVDLKIWLCEVTEFVFECIPQKIYFAVVKRL